VRCFKEVLENPPSIDSVLTIKHTGFFSTGRVRDPFFWRIRKDISWDDILLNPTVR